MSAVEQFFTFSFISTFAVVVVATWWRYVPNIIAYYRRTTSQYEQSGKTVNS